MKIVDVSAFYTPHGGGVKIYVESKLRIAAAHGHEVVIVVPGLDDRIEKRPDGGRIVHLASPALPFDRRYRYFANGDAVHALLDAEQPDLIEASSPWRTASIVADWQGQARRALIMHADPLAAFAYRWFRPVARRDTIDRQFQWFWNHMRRTAAGYDMVVCANLSFAHRLSDGGVPGVGYIPMGVDPGIFSPTLRDEALRQDLLARCGLGPEATLLLGIGRHSAEKRWPMVIDACQRAGLEQPVGLVLIGAGRHQLKIVRHIGNNPHVHLLAPIADRTLLARVMASADALIHGSEAETFGLAVAEAVASGLPLIVPSEGAAADRARPDCAEIYDAADVTAATDAIFRLLARDRSALRQAAIGHARDIRTMDTHFAELFAAYEGFDRPDRKAA